jgi:hypothetical protein
MSVSSNYDCTLAIGLGQATLNNGITALYNKDGAKEAIFSGSVKIIGGMSVLWEISAPPTIIFSPPTPDWSGYIDGDKKPFTYTDKGMTISASVTINASIKFDGTVTPIPIPIPISITFFGVLTVANEINAKGYYTSAIVVDTLALKIDNIDDFKDDNSKTAVITAGIAAMKSINSAARVSLPDINEKIFKPLLGSDSFYGETKIAFDKTNHLTVEYYNDKSAVTSNENDAATVKDKGTDKEVYVWLQKAYTETLLKTYINNKLAEKPYDYKIPNTEEGELTYSGDFTLNGITSLVLNAVDKTLKVDGIQTAISLKATAFGQTCSASNATSKLS